jgi:hypothetical protein
MRWRVQLGINSTRDFSSFAKAKFAAFVRIFI